MDFEEGRGPISPTNFMRTVPSSLWSVLWLISSSKLMGAIAPALTTALKPIHLPPQSWCMLDRTHLYVLPGLMFQNIEADPLYEWGNFYTRYVSEIESDPVGDFTRCREVFAELFGADQHVTDEGKSWAPSTFTLYMHA